MPAWDRLTAEWPTCRLEASGEAVGLPAGQMGNSEVGHLNLGAGFPVLAGPAAHQPRHRRRQLLRQRRSLRAAARPCRSSTGRRLHLLGSSVRAAIHARRRAHRWPWSSWRTRRACPPTRVLLHAFTDGRDTPPRSAAAAHAGAGGAARRARHRSRPSAAATTPWTATSAGTGRQRAWDAIVHGRGDRCRRSAPAAVARAHAARRGRRVHPADRDRRVRRHARRRRRRPPQLPGRPGTAADPGAGARRLRRLRPRPPPGRPAGRHPDRVPGAGRAAGARSPSRRS